MFLAKVGPSSSSILGEPRGTYRLVFMGLHPSLVRSFCGFRPSVKGHSLDPDPMNLISTAEQRLQSCVAQNVTQVFIFGSIYPFWEHSRSSSLSLELSGAHFSVRKPKTNPKKERGKERAPKLGGPLA